MIASPWVIVLAGGSGRRLSAVTGGIPKQFYRPDERPSLFSQTVDRFRGFSSPDRFVAVVDRTHRRYVEAERIGRRCRHVLYQPGDRGTAAGVYLGVSAVLEQDPGAMVLLTPADHAVAEPAVFRAGLRVARRCLIAGRSDIVLFGVEPHEESSDLGWIRASHEVAGVRSVDTFVEKPSPDDARRLFDAGAVWNTMVLLGRARALEALFRLHTPELSAVFDHAKKLPRVLRSRFLAERYRDMPSRDFSRDVLTPAERLAVYTWPASVGWSDLGTPDRYLTWSQSPTIAAVTSSVPTLPGKRAVPIEPLRL